jgi:hypothetical protein
MNKLVTAWGRHWIALALVLLAGAVFAADPQYKPNNELGVDPRVDYGALTKLGPWDDRNYQLRQEDLRALPENDEYRHGVPAFFKIETRRLYASQGYPIGEHYPREVNKAFQMKYGGLLQGGVLFRKGLGKHYHPDPKEPRQPLLMATDPLPKVAPVLFQGPFDGTLSDNETSIEFHPTNPNIVIAGSNGSGGQRMSFSSNGGLTWGNSGSLPATCCDPAMDWSPDGSIAFSASLASGCGQFCTVVFWSFNDGQNWVGPVVLSSGASDKEFIHVDKSPISPFFGRAYVTWHQSNVMQFARSTAMPVQSPAAPMTFATPIAFSAEERGIGSDITTDRQGRIYYVWPTVTDNSAEMRVLRSDDGGVTFVDLNGAATGLSSVVYDLHGEFDFPIPSMETRQAFIYAAAEADVSGGPRDGRIYVAFTDENAAAGSPGNGTGSASANHGWIQVAYSDDQGVTWQVATTPHSTADQTTVDRFQPWLDIDQLGNLHIGWQDTRNSGAGLRNKADWYYAASQDGGATWIEETRVSSVVSENITDNQEWGDYNGVAVAAGAATVGMTWTDNRIVTPPNATQRSFVGLVQNVVACDAPGTPTIGTATATGPNQVQVTWTDGAPSSAQFNVHRAVGTCAAPGPFTEIATGVAGSPYTDTTVSGGTTYAYRVTGTEATGICESTETACVQVTATGACTLAPTFSGLATATNAGTSNCAIDLGWSAGTAQCGGPLTFNVYRSTTSGFTPAPANQIATGVSGSSYNDSDLLVSGTEHFYVVRAVDTANSAEESNTVRRSAIPTGAVSTSNFVETFEGTGGFDNAGWTHQAVTGATDWVWSTTQAQTPTHSWFSDSISSISTRVLTTPSFGVIPSTTLSFFHTFAFEGSVAQCFDAGTLEVSTNGGTSWTVMPDAAFTAGGFNGTVNSGFSNPLAGKRAWCSGTIGPMTQVSVNLAAFAGQNIQLRWNESDDSSAQATGWFVDSVTINNAGTAAACSSGPSSLIFGNGFE